MSKSTTSSIEATHAYVLCGWHLQSDILLNNVPKVARHGESVDVRIQIASGSSPISQSPRRVIFDHSTECSYIRIGGVADFEISNGQLIRVWPDSGASQNDVEIFLLGLAWATLCHQRGMLPLHASAIMTKKGITAFVGHSGAGKSTTAALMGSLGYKLVSDDILPISLNQNSVPGAWPYLRRLKLHRHSIIRQLALTASDVVSETRDKKKYFVIPKYTADDSWRRLERIYLLEVDPTGSEITIDRICGAEAVRALIDQTYHYQFIIGGGRYQDHLRLSSQIASKVGVYRLRRPLSLGPATELGALVREHLEDTKTREK